MPGARLGRLPFSGSSAGKRPTDTPSVDNAPLVERLPLLAELLTSSAAGRCVAMDFGPASSGSIALFNDMHCRVEIVNFPEVLPALSRARDVEDFSRRLAAVLPSNDDHPASLVLLWDFLNYLPRGAITLLMQHLTARARPDLRVHALIAYTPPEIPARPCRYTPSGRDGVRVQPQVDTQRESPRYTPKDLLRCMPNYEIQRAMMLRNGYQEYVLKFAEAKEAPTADDKDAGGSGVAVASKVKPSIGDETAPLVGRPIVPPPSRKGEALVTAGDKKDTPDVR